MQQYARFLLGQKRAAITFVGSAVDSNTNNAAVKDHTYANGFQDESGANVSPQAGDFLLVFSGHAGTAGRTLAQLAPLSDVTGIFTAAQASPNNLSETNFPSCAAHYQFIGASDTKVSLVNCGASGNSVGFILFLLRGVNATTPIDVTTTVATSINNGTPNCPSITPVTPGAWIFAFGMGAQAAGVALTIPSGASTRTNFFRQILVNATNDAAVGGAIYPDWASGAVDPAAFGGGSGAVSTDGWAAECVAIRPA